MEDIFLINLFFLQENIKKCPQSILYDPIRNIQYFKLVQNLYKSYILFNKTGSLRDLYVMIWMLWHYAEAVMLKIKYIKIYNLKISCTQSKVFASIADEQALLKFIRSPGIY